MLFAAKISRIYCFTKASKLFIGAFRHAGSY